MSAFGSLNTAVSGLAAAQRALDATGQNVVNANTPGYSRQRVQLASAGAATTATFHTGGGGVIGGVTVEGVSRIHDAFVEATRASAGSRQSALAAQTSTLSGAQLLFAEPGVNGLQEGLDQFYGAWHELSLNPTVEATGSIVIEKGQAVADQLHAVSNGLADHWSGARENLAGVVAQTNQASTELANLNEQIALTGLSGSAPNELLDRRDTLVRSLADLVGGVATPGAGGQVSVAVNGISIVSGTDAQALTLGGASDLSGALADPPTLMWKGTAVAVESGSAAGYLAALRTDLPSLSANLDSTAVALRDAVNTVYGAGFTLAAAGASGIDGQVFFAGTGARDLSVVPVLPSELAVASAADVTDGGVALKIGDLADDVVSAATLGGGAGASAQWRSMTTSLGVQLHSLQTANSVQDSVVSAADDAVAASSGVNLDEEMTNMLMYQRAYQASARVITTIDSMLDTLINRTGI